MVTTVNMVHDSTRGLLRRSIMMAGDARYWPVLRHRPFSWGVRWGANRFIPWASRTAFSDGIQVLNGIRMVIPRPPDWGGGGEFHMALGTYEHTELQHVLSRLKPGDGFLDVGAHIGYFSLPVAKLVGADGRVFSVEPWSASAALLRHNVGLNGFEHVTVIESAASDEDGEAAFTVSRLSPMWNTLRHGTLDGETHAVTVKTRTLDSLMAEHGWPSIAGIKLDVEGAESQVLRGSEQLLNRNPGAFLIFEVAGGRPERISASLESLRVLEQRGYRFSRLGARGLLHPASVAGLLPSLHSSDWQESLINLVAERI